MSPIDKLQLQHAILERLGADLALAQRAAQTAYEAATDEENIAENKYDTLGLEASYLAAGQAKRVEEIRQALNAFEHLAPRTFDPQQGIQLGALILLADAQGREQWLFLGPDGAGLKVRTGDQVITVITPRAPLGQCLLGKALGDEVEIHIHGHRQHFEVLQVE